jgi:hypothetical protein
MISSPSSKYDQLSQPSTTVVVWLGPADGSAPDSDGEVSWLIPVRSSILAGARRDDVLMFETRDMIRLQDTKPPVEAKQQIEIRGLDEDGEPTILYGWGSVARAPQRIDGQSEKWSVEARIGDQHFGQRLTKIPTFNKIDEERLDVDYPLIFNPEIDGIVEGNMSTEIPDGEEWHYLIHPDSCRTLAARTLQGQDRESWKLSDAVLMVCWLLNPDQDFILNPTQKEVAAAFTARDSLLKNVEIPTGASLPEVLDILLDPFEYSWHLWHSLNEDGARETRIKFFARGEGYTAFPRLQRVGDSRDISQTNVLEMDAHWSIVDLANEIVGLGDFVKVEDTFELSKAWSTDHDSRKLSELKLGESFATDNPSVGRKWVVNEAGDYVGVRPEITFADGEGERIRSDLFEDVQSVRRRRLLRCLSEDSDEDNQQSLGVRVEWYNWGAKGRVNPTASKTDPGWQRVQWPFSVLEKEMGIYFEGATPPEPLWRYIQQGHPEKALLRVTATVAADQRVRKTAERRETSPNGLPMVLVLDLSDRFVKTSVATTSVFDGKPNHCRDDSIALQNYVDAVQEVEDACRLDMSLPIEGVHHPEFRLSDIVPELRGRGYSLKLNSSGRSPQIMGIVWNFQSQQTELLLETFKRERPHFVINGGAGGSGAGWVGGIGQGQGASGVGAEMLRKIQESGSSSAAGM